MARNKVFKRRYTLVVKGVTTNNFMVRFLDQTLTAFVRALQDRFKTLDVLGFMAEDVTGKKLGEVYKCEGCGASMWNDGETTCLLCDTEGRNANADVHD